MRQKNEERKMNGIVTHPSGLMAPVQGPRSPAALPPCAPAMPVSEPVSMIHHTSLYFVIFGAISLLLGMVAYFRKRSIPSLVIGGFFGLALTASGLMIEKQISRAGTGMGGVIFGLVLCVLLAGRFIPVFIKKRELYPAGILATLSLVGLILGLITLTRLF